MKVIKTLILILVAVYLFSNRDISARFAFKESSSEYTRGAIMSEKTKEVASIAKRMDFDCVGYEWPTGYKNLSNEIGLILLWGERSSYKVSDNRMAQANNDTIWMFVQPCHLYAKETFFHEVGHAVLKHSTNPILSDEEKQDEADHFAYQVLKSIGVKTYTQRMNFDY